MKLSSLELKGFRSIDRLGQQISFGDITLLLGANGSGKSNLVSFFKMLNFMNTGALQNFVGKYGVNQLLYFGPKETDTISFGLKFESESATDSYEVKLARGLPDRFFITAEKVTFHDHNKAQPQTLIVKGGGAETGIGGEENATCKMVHRLLAGIRVFHFHDTTDTAKIKDRGYVDDVSYLRSDGGNLAAFLKMLKEHPEYAIYYNRIIRHIRNVMPQFGDFSLETIEANKNYVRLNWVDCSGSDYLFGPDQISDGSLRFMALTTLLLQPPKLLPRFIVLDEPELGLHPAALSELAGMIRIASQDTQVLVATQSTRLVDEFEPDQLVVVERNEGRRCSEFKRLELDELHFGRWVTTLERLAQKP